MRMQVERVARTKRSYVNFLGLGLGANCLWGELSDIHTSDLCGVPWDSAFIYDDINDIWAHWYKLFIEVIDRHAPFKKKLDSYIRRVISGIKTNKASGADGITPRLLKLAEPGILSSLTKFINHCVRH
ncbi:hypothetical protein P5673_009600 [Acropora cervicornis]|uniref:Uncharacterized protein n=1 Tax=Acropora cervicornis TaxID=6130 RepID=A0AAD9QRP3_ACRCE|nr:hypothetical protein P5673_009600 [Acropora cervicornis]